MSVLRNLSVFYDVKRACMCARARAWVCAPTPVCVFYLKQGTNKQINSSLSLTVLVKSLTGGAGGHFVGSLIGGPSPDYSFTPVKLCRHTNAVCTGHREMEIILSEEILLLKPTFFLFFSRSKWNLCFALCFRCILLGTVCIRLICMRFVVVCFSNRCSLLYILISIISWHVYIQPHYVATEKQFSY